MAAAVVVPGRAGMKATATVVSPPPLRARAPGIRTTRGGGTETETEIETETETEIGSGSGAAAGAMDPAEAGEGGV